MFENLKQKYAHFVIRKKFLHRDSDAFSYNHIISNASDFFVIMPESDNDFYHSLELLKYFILHKKTVTLFIAAHKYNLIPEKDKYKFFSYLPGHINRFYLPRKNMISSLSARNYDIVIDLNRTENIFFSAVANLVKAKVRAGFKRTKSEGYYNLLISGKNQESEEAYSSFLHYLQMF